MTQGNGQEAGLRVAGTVRPRGRRVSAEARERWRSARRFQMAVRRALDVPFFEWLLLESLAELLEERTEPVSQVAVAARAGVSEKVTSYWMLHLAQGGLVNREPDWDGRAYEVLLSDEGERMLDSWNEALRGRGILGGGAAP